MVDPILNGINQYIENQYKDGLTGISTLADFCKQPIWKIYLAIKKLEAQRKLEIVPRYFCPEGHPTEQKMFLSVLFVISNILKHTL